MLEHSLARPEPVDKTGGLGPDICGPRKLWAWYRPIFSKLGWAWIFLSTTGPGPWTLERPTLVYRVFRTTPQYTWKKSKEREGNKQRVIFNWNQQLYLHQLSWSSLSLSAMALPSSDFPSFQEIEIGTQGLRKRILKEGISWQTPFKGDEVQGMLPTSLFLSLFLPISITPSSLIL